MKKFWVIGYRSRRSPGSIGISSPSFDNRAEAEDQLRRTCAGNEASQSVEWLLLEAVAAAKVPVPNIEVITLS